MIPFDDLVATLHKAAPGRVSILTYHGLKQALAEGQDVWNLWDTLTLRAVVRNHGTPEQKARLQKEILAHTGVK